MNAPSTTRTAPAPPQPALICIDCGYTLEGLSPDGPCPECATPIARSIAARDVRFPSPHHLHSALRAVTVLRFGSIGFPVAVVLAMVGILISMFLPLGMGGGLGNAMMALFLLAWAAWQVGWAWLALRDPTTAPDASRPRDNRVVVASTGATALLCLAILLISTIAWVAAPPPAPGLAPPPPPATASPITLVALMRAGFWALPLLAAAQAFGGAYILWRILGPRPKPRRKTGEYHPRWLRKSARNFLLVSLVILALKAALLLTGRAAYINSPVTRGGPNDPLGESLSIIAFILGLGAFLLALSILAQTIVLSGRARADIREAIERRRLMAATAEEQSAP